MTLRLSIPILALAGTLAVAGPGRADDDQARARAAVEAGRALPLHEIIRRARAAHGGEIIDVEFEDEDGRAVYELKILTPDGRRLEVEYDAADGTLLKVRGRHGPRRR